MYYQLKSLILCSKVSGEADKLIKVYTYEWGKISAIVPGAKKINAKLACATEPVTESSITVYLKNPQARPKITGAVILNAFPVLRSDWRGFWIAQYCAEITEILTPFNSANERKYELLLRTWKLLENAVHPWRIFSAFTLRFLKLSGYSFIEYLKRENSSIPKKEIKIIQSLAALSGEDVDKNTEMDETAEKNVMKHLENYLKNYLPRPLAAKEFWQQINSEKFNVQCSTLETINS